MNYESYEKSFITKFKSIIKLDDLMKDNKIAT